MCILIFYTAGPVEVELISNHTLVNMDETAVLVCVGYGAPDVQIRWSFDGVPVVNATLTAIYESDFTRGVRVHKQSFLQLCGVTVLSAGNYTCTVDNGVVTANATTQLTVQGE